MCIVSVDRVPPAGRILDVEHQHGPPGTLRQIFQHELPDFRRRNIRRAAQLTQKKQGQGFRRHDSPSFVRASYPPVVPGRPGPGRFRDSSPHSFSTWWTRALALDPSPTADATRFWLPRRTSPTANTPGRLVSRWYGARVLGHPAALRSSGARSVPVLTNPLSSSAT